MWAGQARQGDACKYVKPTPKQNDLTARYFVDEWGTLENATVAQLKAEIYRRGPITCSIDSSPLEQGHYRRGQIVDTQAQTPRGAQRV